MEHILAEAYLEGGVYRLIHDQAGEYVTEYREDERSKRFNHHTLPAALRDFTDTVIQEEITS